MNSSTGNVVPVAPHRSSIAHWTLKRLVVLLLGIGSLSFVFSVWLLQGRYDAFDARSYSEEVSRVIAVIKTDEMALRSSVTDNALWTDTYNYVRGIKPGFLGENFTAASIKNLSVDAVVVTGLSGQLLGSTERKLDDNLGPVSAETVSVLTRASQPAGAGAATEATTYLVWLGQRPALVARSPITDSDGLKAANGYLYFVKFLEQDFLARVQELTGVSFALEPYEPDTGTTTSVTKRGNQWLARTAIFDSAAQISHAGPGYLGNEQRITTALLAANALLLVGLSLAGSYFVLNRRVLKRLAVFSTLADRLRQGDKSDLRWPDAGVDEFDNLAASLNDLLLTAKNQQTELAHLANHDPLTQLPNRRLLLDRLPHALATRKRTGSEGALMFIDLDKFKELNDTHGHATGDQLLIAVAQRLNSCVRETDMVVRLGGDEFMVMIEGLGTEPMMAARRAQEIAAKILNALNQPYLLGDEKVTSTPSIGLALFNGDKVGAAEMLQRADLAMYEAKSVGRNAVRFFDPQMQAEISQRVKTENDMREGMWQQQFIPYYQCQVDDRGAIIGAELLVRWAHPTRGLVPPNEFIPIAEASGLIRPMGHLLLEAACFQLAAWARNPRTANLTLAVNVSPSQFLYPDFNDLLVAMLAHTGANPHRLKLELTENALMNNIEDVATRMHQIKALGVTLSLDDFGTGYSSLSYLRLLPLDQLKVDQSFVRNLMTDPSSVAIARTVISLARNLGLEVISEGVETEQQRECLSKLGCGRYQGYLFGRPLPLADFEQLVAGNHPAATVKAATTYPVSGAVPSF